MSRFKAVIFDLDGTLLDSMWLWREIDIEYLGGFGIDIPWDLQKSIEGKSFTETAIYFKERFEIPDTVEQITEYWNKMAMSKYCNKVTLKPGAREFIVELHNKNIKLGIATSNSRELTEAALSSKGIHEYFQAIVTGDDVKRGKPNPEIYLRAAKLLNASPCDCLVFEDVPQGILAAKNAGMTACAVDDEYSRELLNEKKMLADYFVTDYNKKVSALPTLASLAEPNL